MFFIRLNRFVICAFLAGLSFFAMTSTMIPEWVDMRYYLPLLILLIAVAVLPVTWAAENLFVARRAIASLTIFVLFAAASLGYPSRSLSNTPKTVAPGSQAELESVAGLGRSPFPHSTAPFPVVEGAKAFS